MGLGGLVFGIVSLYVWGGNVCLEVLFYWVFFCMFE